MGLEAWGGQFGTPCTFEGGREMEGASFARLALYPNPPLHHVDQARADGQPQPGASVLARDGSVSLGKRLKDCMLLFGRDADAGVPDGEMELRHCCAAVFRLNLNADCAAIGKLECITE